MQVNNIPPRTIEPQPQPRVRVELGTVPQNWSGTPEDYADLIREILLAVGCYGIFALDIVTQVRWRVNQVFGLSRQEGGTSLRIKLKPGDNSTAWVCILRFVEVRDFDMAAIMAAMRAVESWDGNNPEQLKVLASNYARQGANIDPVAAQMTRRLQELRARAANHAAMQERVIFLRREAEACLKEAEQLEQEAGELQATLDNDQEAAVAAAQLQQIEAILHP